MSRLLRSSVRGLLAAALLAWAGLGRAAAPAPSLVPPAEHVDDAQTALLHARLLSYQRETWAAAAAAYESILARRPTDPLALAELADVLVRLGRSTEARARLESALAQRPADPALRLHLARLQLWAGENRTALATLEHPALADAPLAEVLALRATALSQAGQTAAAVALFDQALAAAPNPSAALLLAAGDALLHAGRPGDALPLYDRALRRDPALDRARRQRALALTRHGTDAAAARNALLAWLAHHPADEELASALNALEAARDPHATLKRLRQRVAAAPDDRAARRALADLAATNGHGVEAAHHYDQLLAAPGDAIDSGLALVYARAALGWGDVYRTEEALRARLAAAPTDEMARRDLGRLLVSFDRTEEAEALYRRWLLDQPAHPEARLGLVQLRLKERRYEEALAWLDELRAETPTAPTLLALRARTLDEARNTDAARHAYEELSTLPDHRLDATIALGRLARRGGDEEQAGRHFAAALALAPGAPAARYHASTDDERTSEPFLAALETAPAQALLTWANLYAADGRFDLAVRCLAVAHRHDPAAYPAHAQLAEFLAIDRRYDEAIAAFAELEAAYPDNRQVLLNSARAHAWSRRYDEALDRYDRLLQLAPHDPVPRREAARTAGWAKRREAAAARYAEQWHEPVDTALARGLRPLLIDLPLEDTLTPWHTWLAEPEVRDADVPFAATARFDAERDQVRAALPEARRATLDRLWLDLLPAYRLQRQFYLEDAAKQLAWTGRFTRAVPVYERLLALEPGNQEALFDLAQAQAALGLGDRERTSYARLLALDANNRLAARGLFRRERRSEPLLELSGRHWHEAGRGALSSIRRTHGRLEWSDTFHDRHRWHLAWTGGFERPETRDGRYAWRGVGFGLEGVANAWLSGGAAFEHREFYDGRIGHVDTGRARLAANVHDAARIAIGYEKREELTNEFALFRGIRSDQWWVSADVTFHRRFDASLRLTRLDYSDGNEGLVATLQPALTWSDHPRIFRTLVTLEHRDHDQTSRYLYDGARLVDIVHPYWSPRGYTGAGLTLQWYHDLAREFFVGAPVHFYDLRLTFGTDSESNAGVTFQAEWRREWRDRWLGRAALFLSRSREWDAEGLELSLGHRF